MVIGRAAIITEWLAGLDALDSARQLLDGNKPNDSISRSYYAFMHTARAALMTQGRVITSHRGLKVTFGEHLVRPGHFEREWSTLIQKASEARMEADYGAKGRMPLKRATKQAEEASRFVERTRAFLKTQEFADHELARRNEGLNTPDTDGSETPGGANKASKAVVRGADRPVGGTPPPKTTATQKPTRS